MRYSAVVDLDQVLDRLLPGVRRPPLPPKRFALSSALGIGPHDSNIVSERVRGLDAYFKGLLATPELRVAVVLNALDPRGFSRGARPAAEQRAPPPQSGIAFLPAPLPASVPVPSTVILADGGRVMPQMMLPRCCERLAQMGTIATRCSRGSVSERLDAYEASGPAMNDACAEILSMTPLLEAVAVACEPQNAPLSEYLRQLVRAGSAACEWASHAEESILQQISSDDAPAELAPLAPTPLRESGGHALPPQFSPDSPLQMEISPLDDEAYARAARRSVSNSVSSGPELNEGVFIAAPSGSGVADELHKLEMAVEDVLVSVTDPAADGAALRETLRELQRQARAEQGRLLSSMDARQADPLLARLRRVEDVLSEALSGFDRFRDGTAEQRCQAAQAEVFALIDAAERLRAPEDRSAAKGTHRNIQSLVRELALLSAQLASVSDATDAHRNLVDDLQENLCTFEHTFRKRFDLDGKGKQTEANSLYNKSKVENYDDDLFAL